MIDFGPEEEPLALEAFHVFVRLFELFKDYYWIVDRFHISTLAHQLLANERSFQFDWLEERLVTLNFRLVHCVRRADTFERARADRLVYSENPHRYSDLGAILREQDVFRNFVSKSSIPSMELDVSDDGLDVLADSVIDWLEATDAFYRPSGT